jgi:hypothetical protein
MTHGMTTYSKDAKKFGPSLRFAGFNFSDEQIRTRLKNSEKKWYDQWLASGGRPSSPILQQQQPTATAVPPTAQNRPNVPQTARKLDAESEGEEEENEDDRDFIASDSSSGEGASSALSMPLCNSNNSNSATNTNALFNSANITNNAVIHPAFGPYYEISPYPIVSEKLDVFSTDEHVFIVTSKTPCRDVWMGVVDNPNGVGSFPSRVLQVDEVVFPTSPAALSRLTGGAEIIAHDKPVKQIRFCCLPPDAIPDSHQFEIFDKEVHGLRLHRRARTGNLVPTQVSLQTASQPLSIGAPMLQRTYALSGFQFPALPSNSDEQQAAERKRKLETEDMLIDSSNAAS